MNSAVQKLGEIPSVSAIGAVKGSPQKTKDSNIAVKTVQLQITIKTSEVK